MSGRPPPPSPPGWRSSSIARRLSALILVLGLAGLTIWGLDWHFPPALERAGRLSTLVLDAEGRLLRGFTSQDDAWRLPVTPAEVSPLYRQMLLAYEDQRFAHHPGVDPLALVRALGQWAWQGRIVSGASTLTMQTARLLEPRPRTLGGKSLEMARALQLEWHLTKDDILALYLTLAPFGGNLEGIRAAALAWLGKEPRHLTPAEAALLVALPQSPERLRPDRHPQAARQARDKVLARMVVRGVLSETQAREARQEPVPTRRRPLPFHAPHLARRLVAAEPDRALIPTTLDGQLQATLEGLAPRWQQVLPPGGGVAVLVVENATRRVRAWLGSGDFFDGSRAGQVDMVTARRSPGSTLKPLIYGMGFDDLLIHPDSRVTDAPTAFGEYRPANFRHAYHGEVTIREALQQSLNVPAVMVLERVGPGRLAARLREAGIPLYLPEGAEPGLPLALGGVGTTLEGLVTLYTGLANSGLTGPLVYTADQPPGETRQLLGAAACWYLADILRQAPPPAAGMADRHRRRPRGVAYKTGTSYGFRDAWAVGYNARHTVGIWLGRPDGTPLPGHYGRESAAPLLMQVFDLLPSAPLEPGPPPPGVLTGPLPRPLERLMPRQEALATGDPPRVSFPVDGSRVELTWRDGRLAPLPLVAQGGRPPLHWWVNGQPLAGRGRQANWQPDGEGFATIGVVDADGRAGRVRVRLTGRGTAILDGQSPLRPLDQDTSP